MAFKICGVFCIRLRENIQSKTYSVKHPVFLLFLWSPCQAFAAPLLRG